MRTEHPPNRLLTATGIAAVGRVCALQSRNPALRADADALLFSAKSFAAAMLACYISLRVGLPRPYWAILTV
jgi:hypothetical protein